MEQGVRGARGTIDLAAVLACAQIIDFYLEIRLEIEFSSLYWCIIV